MPPRKSQSEYPQKFINPHRLFYGVWLPHWLEGRLEVSEKAKKLYAHLTYFAGDKGYAWPTLNTLSEKLHVSRRHVIRLVKELTHHGLIAVMNVNRPGKGSCANHYRFLWHPWMQEEQSHGVNPDHGETLALEEAGDPNNSMASPVISPSDKNVTPPGDIDVTPPGDMRVTPRVTPMSPKENHKKRLIKKYPKGASGNSVPLQATAPDSYHLAIENVQPPSGTPGSHAAPEPRELIRSKDFSGDGGKSKTSAALARKGWAIARRLLAEFWENCKVKPNLGILSGYAIRSLQLRFHETDIILAFERALHECHAHATDSGESWEASSTVYRAEQLLKQYTNRWKPLMEEEQIVLRKHIESSLTEAQGGDKAESAIKTSSERTFREKKSRLQASEEWPSPMEVRAAFNAIRRAAGVPEKPPHSNDSPGERMPMSTREASESGFLPVDKRQR